MADSTESETEAESETNDENEVQTSLPTTSRSSCRKFTGAARYKSTFQNEWTVKYKTFLCQVHGNIHAFYCNVCKKEVSVKHQGERDVIRHKDGEDHKRWERSLRNQPILNLATSSTNTLLFNTSKAEVLAAKFIVEHNLPISVSDHLGPLFRQMFPDSTIAKNYASAHTKTNCRINDAIAPPMQQELVSQMKNGPFSLAIDGSSDNDLEKMNPLTVCIFDINTHKVEGRFLDMCSATASTAQAIYDKMNEVLNKHDIPWDYCVGMSVDNTSVNVGRHNSIKTRVEDANDTVYFMGCPCHILHNTAFYGGKAFEEIVNFSADDLCVDILYWFEHSSKRKNLLIGLENEN
ncbi:methyltransferase 15 [Paramuricea clavata]|uniref:Methyltransferase 15 n=1 Tax=Paramuricea clavata TaxID=317549 RepID=A0A6S7KC73_PARCT|nr:methyltransferase 15 [Paramuricea clavata]